MIRNSATRRAFLGYAAAPVVGAAAGWEKLAGGTALEGWRAEGKARWSVEDGAIVGRQGEGGAPGDLFTVKTWTDFELECEWRMKWPGNSGIWFRYMGPNTGYQADFLDEPKAYPDALSGSLYCMGKAFIARNADASSLRKDGWNRMRIRSAGPKHEITLNGRKVVSVEDTAFAGPGSIGIQVHQGKAFEGMEVRVRGLRIRSL